MRNLKLSHFISPYVELAKCMINICRSYISGDSLREQPETGTRPPLAGPYAFSRLPPPLSPRYFLTVAPHSTWTFTNVTLG